MKLRTILLVLALLAFLSASIGGLFYFHSLKEFAFEEAGKVAAVKATTVKDRVASYLSENLQIIKALAGIRALQQALAGEDARSLESASSLLANLDYFDDALGYDSCFLLDRAGNAIASSASDDPVGFKGENHKSSSFVRIAMEGTPAFYMSRGNNQQQPDVYFSHPVYGENKDIVIGVVVIRASTGPIEYELKQFEQGIVLLIDPHGDIFASNHKDWLYQRLWRTAPDGVPGTTAKQTVVQGSSGSVGLELRDEKYAVDGGGNEYLIYQMGMVNYPGWKIIYLVSLDEISESLLAPLLRTSGYAILILCLLVGGSVLFLYRIASRDIAQRKTAEEALRESEEKFRAISGTAADAIILMDDQGKISYWNPAAEKMFGYTPEEAVGEELHIFVASEEFHETYARGFNNFRNTGEDPVIGKTAEFVALRKDGTQFPIEVSTSALNIKGQWHSAGIIRDISERKRAENEIKKLNEELEERVIERSAELFESEQRHRSLLEASADPIAVYDMKGRVTYLNPAFTQTFGWSLEELVGKRIDFVPEESRPETQEAINSMLAGEKVQLFETRRLTKDGRVLDIQLSTSLFLDRDGQAAGNIVILRDVTKSKRAEEALRRAHDELELRVTERTSELMKANVQLKQEVEERTRLATVVDQAAESVIISDRRGTIQYVNPAFERLSGFTQYDIVGQNFRILKSDKHNKGFYKEMWDTISCGGNWTGRISNRMKDGTLREFETSISPIRDGSGAIVNFVSVNRDVTQEVALEAQLFQAQKMEAVGTLAGGIAHDFNNLLQVIQGYTEVLLNGVNQDQLNYEPLQKIHRSAKRGAELTRQLLTFSRKVQSEKRSLDLNHEVEQVKNLLEHSIAKMIEIELHLTEIPLFVNGDPVQIEQALMNLAVNAMDAMSEGGKIVIETEKVILNKDFCNTHLGAKPGTYALLCISDNGHGMTRETLEHVFEPFYTTKDVGKGTGLGLAMVYGIVKNHEGYIMCYSEPDTGTTFKIYLPAMEQEEGGSEVEEAEDHIPAGTENILLVDDEEYIRELGAELLGDAGYNVLTATDGESGLELYENNLEKIDLVILDLVIPGMGGKRCYEEIFKINRKAKILIVSGYPFDGPGKEALKAGAKGFVGKPFDVVQMLKTVREILDQD